MFVPTDSQLAARDLFLVGESLKIKAFAGCGKTTTLEFIARSGGGNGLYVAFNNAIARESASKFRNKARCMTTHAMALRHLPPEMKTKAGQGLGLRRSHLSAFIKRRCARDDVRTVDRAREVQGALREFCLSADREPGLQHVHAMEGHLLQNVDPARVLRDLHVVWASISDPAGELPLSHDTYLKWFHIHGAPLPYAYILVDESQDQTPVVVDLLRRSGRQVVWVGDPHQELYAWRGAVNAMETIGDVNEVVLSKCFRFGPKLAEVASALLVDLGEYTPLIGNDDIDTVIAKRHQPVRIVRNNMTLLAKVAHLAKRNTIFVVGGTSRLEKLVADTRALMQGKRVASGQLFGFTNWAEVQDRANGRYGHPYKDFVKVVDEIGCRGVSGVLSRLASSAANSDITLTTVHNSKGCQFDYVSVYDDFRGEKERGRFVERMPVDVTRLLYVAVTRAKHGLFMDRSLANRFQLTRILQAPAQVPHPHAEQDSPELPQTKANVPAACREPNFSLAPRDLKDLSSREARSNSNMSAYGKYGDVLNGMAIGLFLWILLH